MTKFIASVRDSYDGQLMTIEKEYETKKAFESDLKGNGYKIRFITTEEKFDEDCEKYHERIKRQNTIRKAVNESRKESAKRLGMTLKEYILVNAGKRLVKGE